MMNRYTGTGWRVLPRLVLTATVGMALTACDTDELLQVDEPEFATPETLATAAGVPVLYAGAVGDFQIAYSGTGDTNNEGFLSVSSLFGDELRSSDTFTTRNATDSRNQFPTSQGNTTNTAYNRLQYARRSAGEIAEVVVQFFNTQDPRYATLKSLEGFAITALGEGWCGAVPLSTSVGSAPRDEGAPLSTAQLFQQAVSVFDAALGGSPNSNLARVGKGRALLNNAKTPAEYAAAAAAVSAVPTTFIHRIEHSVNTTRQNNPIWALQDGRRYTVSDVEGINGLPYRSANDPRVPWVLATVLGFDESTPLFRAGRYPLRDSPVILADGIEARLIEAEAAFHNGGDWLAILNTLRAGVQSLMAARYPGYTGYAQATNPLPPLTDPGTDAARVDLIFRERAFWLFLTGHRLGDLRRLVRNYNRPQDTVFPTGAWHKGGQYGTDVTFPIPFNEGQNTQYDHDMCNTKQA